MEQREAAAALSSDNWVDRLRSSLIRHSGLVLMVIIVVAAACAVSLWSGRRFNPGMANVGSTLAAVLLPPFLLIVLVCRFLRMATVERPADPIKFFLKDLRGLVPNVDCVLDGLVLVALLTLFLSSFSYLKDCIPYIEPFSWDPTFARLDRILFCGYEPWRVLQPFVGSPFATTVLNMAYNGWFFLSYFLMISLAFYGKNQELRFSFAYGFLLTWTIGGVVLAILLSSAGPVYFERLGFGSEYAPLMASLRANSEVYPVWSLDIQRALWQSYIGGHGVVSGISAMPSMHIANAVFFAAVGYRIKRAVGVGLTIFAGVIFIGSIQLGWHYAVDGIVGTAVAIACWRLGCLLARLDLQRHARLGCAMVIGSAARSS